MNIKELILRTTSTRAFNPVWTIDDATIKDLIRLGTAAPNAGNEQSWYFYVYTTQERKDELSEICYSQDFVKEASIVIVCCLKNNYETRYKDIAQFYKIQDIACACQNILLGCQQYGLGGCYVGAFDRVMLKRLLLKEVNLENIISIIAIGKPIGEGSKPPRKNVEEVCKII